MPQYLIRQSPKPSGEVPVSTAKNAALPMMAAALLTNGTAGL